MLKTILRFFPPKLSNKCPYCSLNWKYNESFRFIGKRCIFRPHTKNGNLKPSRFDVNEAQEVLEENGFKVAGSLFEHGHYVILLGGKNGRRIV